MGSIIPRPIGSTYGIVTYTIVPSIQWEKTLSSGEMSIVHLESPHSPTEKLEAVNQLEFPFWHFFSLRKSQNS